MSLAPGTRLGIYDVAALLGVGGMGEVYRARDTTLGRDVALKILPPPFAADADRLARFQREAHVLASLNHPHIATIYGVAEAGGHRALVLELVDGPTLADRIARAPLPLDEALAVARQICDALEAAHEKGVVHRDLKPANIKLTPEGSVKVLDFGLAKLAAGDAAAEPAARLSMSPTLTAHATFAGVVLGTAGYMSPEQAKGQVADRTADVWAFGCVLYEMLTGRAAFTGDSVSEILAEVLKTDPDWTRLPADTPDAVRRLLRRCLERHRARRLRDIADARMDIEDALTAPASLPPARSVLRRYRAAWLAGAVAVAAIAGAATLAWTMRSGTQPVETVVDISTPPMPDSSSFALAPDGRAIAYVAASDVGKRLFVRSLDSKSTRVLAGTDDAQFPFWSPDGRSIGFFAGGKLKRIEVAAGSPRVLANAVAPAGGAWGPDDTILYSPNTSNGPVFRVSALGGKPAAVTHLQIGEGHRSPQFLPDGSHFLYTVSGLAERGGTYVSDLGGGNGRRLMDADDVRFMAPGHLLFVHQGTLFSQRFDTRRLALVGTPAPIVDQVAVRTVAAVSAAGGHLVFRTGSAAVLRQLVWMDRGGRELARVGEPMQASNPSLSPDGRHLALQRNVDGNTDIWLVDLGPRQVLTRLTSDPTLDALPLWSPDGRRLAFTSSRTSYSAIHVMAADGSGQVELLLPTQGTKAASLMDWSLDGKTILYRSIELTGGNADLWAVSLDTRKPFPVVESAFDKRDAQFSPDGQWIAYSSDESGRQEIYVQRFPTAGGKERLSTTGGTQVRWRRDGRELFYLAADGRFMSVSIRLDAASHAVDAAPPVPLFAARVGATGSGFTRQQYVVADDGQRFLVNTLIDEIVPSPPLTLVLNWKPRP